MVPNSLNFYYWSILGNVIMISIFVVTVTVSNKYVLLVFEFSRKIMHIYNVICDHCTHTDPILKHDLHVAW